MNSIKDQRPQRTTSLPLPIGDTVTVDYVRTLVRTLNQFLRQTNNPGPEICSKLKITQIQGNGGSLGVGEVFEEEGVLKIVRENDVLGGTTSSSGAVGTVTVVTS